MFLFLLRPFTIPRGLGRLQKADGTESLVEEVKLCFRGTGISKTGKQIGRLFGGRKGTTVGWGMGKGCLGEGIYIVKTP